MVNGFTPWRKLEARFKDNRCVGISEFRLDTTATDLESQKRWLYFLCSIATPLCCMSGMTQKVLMGFFQTVLHILDTSMTPGHILYLHSYTSDWETALAFRKWSSRTYFRISCATMHSHSPHSGHLNDTWSHPLPALLHQ